MLKGLLKAVVVVVCLYCLLFQGMAGVGMLSADEPRYAAIGQEMARSGDWVTPRLWGAGWFEKPPLVYWLMAAAWKLGLRDEIAARLPGAVLSLAFLVFFHWWMRKEFDADAAWRGAAMLATTAGWIVYSTVAVMDVPLAATVGAAVLLAAPWRERPSNWAGVMLGLAMLAKSFVAPILVLPVAWFWRDRWRLLVKPVGIALVVAMPWYVACYAANGWPMIQELVIRQQLGRFFTDERKHVQAVWFYVPVLIGLLVPWSAALVRVKWYDKRKYLLAVAAFGFVFFSLSQNKLPGYLMPLVPLMIAAAAVEPLPRWGVAVGGALTAVIPAAAVILPEALETGLGRTRLPGLAIWAGIAAVSAGMVALVDLRWRRGWWVVVLLTAGWISWAKMSVYPELDRTVSARGRWREGQRCLADGESRDVQYGLAYYNGAELPRCK